MHYFRAGRYLFLDTAQCILDRCICLIENTESMGYMLKNRFRKSFVLQHQRIDAVNEVGS